MSERAKIPAVKIGTANIGEHITVDFTPRSAIPSRAQPIRADGVLTAVGRGPANSTRLTIDGKTVYLPAHAWVAITATPANRRVAAEYLSARDAQRRTREAQQAAASEAALARAAAQLPPAPNELPVGALVDAVAAELDEELTAKLLHHHITIVGKQPIEGRYLGVRATLPGFVEVMVDAATYLLADDHPLVFRILRQLPQKPGHVGAIVTHGSALRHTAETTPAKPVDRDAELWEQLAAELV